MLSNLYISLLLTGLAALCSASVPVNISTAQIVRPPNVIRCPDIIEETCEIQLRVSYMHTLVAYGVNNGTRTGSGYSVRVNDIGDLEVHPPAFSRDPVTQLFQPLIADGTTQRDLLVINDQLPGPTLIGYTGQRIRITVTNQLGSEAITLHWHGQHVNGTSGSSNQYSDGVPYVTQCPIFPGNSFVYDYVFYPGGTYWYHSHMYDERSNGLYGALVVLDAPESPTADPIDLPAENTISLFEWFPVNSNTYLEGGFSFPDLADPDVLYSSLETYDGSEAGGFQFYAGFMNSNGWRFGARALNCDINDLANNPNPQMCTGPLAPYPLPSFNVAAGSRYRFRLIGSQVTFAYRFSIAGHRLRVVATDGIDATISQNDGYVDYIIIHVGERYDFVVDADQTSANYLMVFETLETEDDMKARCYCIKAHRGYAVLHYETADPAADVDPATFADSYDPLSRCNVSNQCYALNCPFENYPDNIYTTCVNADQMVLTTPEAYPTDVTESVFLNFGFVNGPSINDRSFILPPAPPISQPYASDEADFCQYSELQQPLTPALPPGSPDQPNPFIDETRPAMCTHTYTVPGDVEGVEMVYTNVNSGEAHPVHLHGHHYFVLDTGYPTYNPDGTIDKTTAAQGGSLNCSADNGTCAFGVQWSAGYPMTPPCMVNNTCPLKDTVIVPPGGWVRIRFPRDNWGWWIMHCHIEPHLLGGMAMIVNETSVDGTFPPPYDFPTCGNFENIQHLETPTPDTGALTLEESLSFRNATIALAIICILLLIAVIVLIVVVLICYKLFSKPNVVQVPDNEMSLKRTNTSVEVEVTAT